MSIRLSLRFGALLFAALGAASAHALVFRAYLASDGLDTNPCSLQQPCRLLPAALAAVAGGGEIWMLDSANYNTASVLVNKSVTILAIPGAVGSLVAPTSSQALLILAGVKVGLRNLVFVPLANATDASGISTVGASELDIEDCLFANLPLHGIYATSAAMIVRVAGSTFRDNGGFDVYVSEGPSASVWRSRFLGASYGTAVSNSTAAVSTTLSVSDSYYAGNVQSLWANSFGGTARFTVTRTTIDQTERPLGAETMDVGTAIAAISGSVISNGGPAWKQQGLGSYVRTLGNNHFENSAPGLGTLTPWLPQ